MRPAFPLFVGLFVSGCGNVHLAPKIITVDGKQTAIVCEGVIQVSGSERGAYEVSFTDASGSHDWRGLNKVDIDDMPSEVERSVCHGTGQSQTQPKPPQGQLSDAEIENLRQRNRKSRGRCVR